MSDFYDSLEEENEEVEDESSDSVSADETKVPYYTGESCLGTILREGMQYKIPHRSIFTQSQTMEYSLPLSSRASTSSAYSIDIDSMNDDDTGEPAPETTERVKVMKKKAPKNTARPKLSYLERFRLSAGFEKDDSSSHRESGDSLLSTSQEKESDSEESFYKKMMNNEQNQSMVSVTQSAPDFTEDKSSPESSQLNKMKKPKSCSGGSCRLPPVVKSPEPDPFDLTRERLKKQREYALAANSRNQLNFVKKRALKLISDKEAEDEASAEMAKEKEKKKEKEKEKKKLVKDRTKFQDTVKADNKISEDKPVKEKKKERKSYIKTFPKPVFSSDMADDAALKRMAERHEEDAKMAEMIRKEMEAMHSTDDPLAQPIDI